MNRLIQSLSVACKAQPLAGKILLAPNLRAGNQWLTQVARSGQPAVNVHVKTLRGLALEWAAGALRQSGLSRLPASAGEILAARAWNKVDATRLMYFTGIEPSQGFFQLLQRSLHALRMAGVSSEELRKKQWAGELGKRADLEILFNAYQKELEASKFVDDAQIFEWAMEALRAKDPGTLDTLFVPAGLELENIERHLILAWPESNRKMLACDEPDEQPKAIVQCGLGEAFEVRATLRKVLDKQWPLDQVEILYSDAQTYIPLLQDTAAALQLPLTIAEGLPVRLSRPGRALLGWLEWIDADYSQAVFERMIEQGLLNFPEQESRGIALAEWAQLLRELPIQFGRQRYQEVFKKEIARCEYEMARVPENAEKALAHADIMRWQLAGMEALLAQTPETTEAPHSALGKALVFVMKFTRGQNERDNYARDMLAEQIQRLQACFNPAENLPGFSWLERLKQIPDTAHILGSSARPGHLHAAGVSNGGHTGRPYTLILGLDDSRLPGAGRQDPFVLDHERKQLSEHLELSADRLKARKKEFFTLQGALRGERVFSYSTLDLNGEGARNRSLAWEEAHARAHADAHPESFIPFTPECALDSGESWLLQAARNGLPESQILQHFKNLAAGKKAERARASQLFTEYDGKVEGVSGPALFDPKFPWSSQRLEALGKCPLKFFFKHVLHLEPPDEVAKEPEQWMERHERGNVMHQVFQEVVRELAGGPPRTGTRESVAAETVERVMKKWKEQRPAPAESVWQLELDWMRKAVHVLLAEDAKLGVEPREGVYLEVAVGLPKYSEKSPLDLEHSVKVMLPGFGQLAIHGKIDRIEALDTEGNFKIMDYKSGSRKSIEADRDAGQARLAQPFVYAELAVEALKQKHSGARVVSFEYFFPSPKERGGKLSLDANEISRAKTQLSALCELARQGRFPTTNDKEDCRYCEFARVCGSAEQVAKRCAGKLENFEDEQLELYRELRLKRG